MKPEEIHISDWKRILFGEVPAEFIWEVLIRGLFVYGLLFIALRLMGRRMAALLTRNEWATLIAIASCLSLVLHDPERRLLASAYCRCTGGTYAQPAHPHYG